MTPPLRFLPLPFASDEQLISAVADLPWSVLLTSGALVGGGGRFSIATAAPTEQLEVHGPQQLDRLQQLNVRQPALVEPPQPLPFISGWLGYFSYDAGRLFEQLPEQAQADLTLPWVRLGYYTWSLVSDHHTQTTWLSGYFSDELAQQLQSQLVKPLQPPSPPFQLLAPFTSNMTEAEYRHKFDQVQALLAAGDAYQVNLAQRFSAPFSGNPASIWQALSQAIPAPFSAWLNFGDQQILSLSPERFLRVSEVGEVETKPIKGTRPRSMNPDEDAAFQADLLNNPKDRAENLMIVDLLRNDLGRVCQPGSIRVPELFTLESYTYVHHLVSRITGQLAQQTTAVDLLSACFPGGSITGAPKLRAMQIIESLEPCRRSVYCGSIGYLDDRGNMDFNIAIRTFVADQGHLHLWGGGGLVADSNAEAEYAETLHKVARLIRVLQPDFAPEF